MPELPEVETVRLGLAPVLEGRRILRVEARRGDLRVPFPERFAERLEGRRVQRLTRRAKYLLAGFDDGGEMLLMHLGMSGRMVVDGAGGIGGWRAPVAHDHVVIETDAGTRITFNDARRFGLMTLIAPGDVPAHPLLRGLGPEPLGDGFTAPALEAALAGRSASIKAALLDQRIVAGLGNIYACESLFRAGLSPRRRAGTVRGARARRLVAAIREVLAEAIAAGGSSLRDHVRPSGELGYFQHRFAVYGREGAGCPGCRCDPARGGGVRRIVQAGRSTFYCPVRQR
ncbi:MAG TPA: bifunctional DNA-formamidopyrimidine glycosylase/DNA-(apurinic or apyrimidinic site) lyase [Alphaproteobacteria bacterium]|jgi:formamidopyrimidine-DNA glycosylase